MSFDAIGCERGCGRGGRGGGRNKNKEVCEHIIRCRSNSKFIELASPLSKSKRSVCVCVCVFVCVRVCMGGREGVGAWLFFFSHFLIARQRCGSTTSLRARASERV